VAIPQLQAVDSSLSSEVHSELELAFGREMVVKHKDQIHRQIFFCHDQVTPSPSHRVAQHRPSMFRLNSETDTGDREQRHYIITELVESEEVYNRYLHIILERFETPLRAMSSKIVQQKDLDTIFCNVAELSAVST